MDAIQQIKPTEFFVQHPVFRYREFVAAHSASGRRSRQTSASVLKQHVAAGNLLHIRRGLYATVPRGIPGLLTSDGDLQSTIASHPGLRWKTLNVRKHRGFGKDADS